MIERIINIDDYWKVIVYYNVNYNFFNIIYNTLLKYDIPIRNINNVYNRMSTNKAKAVTISSYKHKVSIVLFNKHKSYYDYINSIVHESEHIKQAMLNYYDINDSGEEPAYTIGYIAMKLLMFLI